MKYYQAIEERYDYFTGYATIENELLLPKERDTKFRYLPDDCFRKVEISRAKTYTMFGARFPFDDYKDKMKPWKLTKEEAENAIMEHVKNIGIITYDYTGEKYITMSWHRDGGRDRCMIFNSVDAKKTIDIYSLFGTKNHPEYLLLDEMLKIKDILDDYCPNDDYFSAFVSNSGGIHLNNSYWKRSIIHKLDADGEVKY